MTTTDWTNATPISTGELPPTITTYLAAHQARDLDTAVAFYDDNSAVTDEGNTYVGRAAIRNWMANVASEYTYTITLIGAAKLDDLHYDALHHLEGDFPGGVVDLHFRFTMRSDTTIAGLIIEI